MLLAIVYSGRAEELEVRLALPKGDFVQGEPVIATGMVRNAANEPLVLPVGGANGFRPVFALERAGGPPGSVCPEEGRKDGSRILWRAVPPDWSETHTRTFHCLLEPGEYVVRFWVSAEGPDSEVDTGRGPPAGRAWSGRNEAPTVAIRITQPMGDDLAAFTLLGGRPLADSPRLLASFPTSTYAGYAILKGGPWQLDPVAELDVRGKHGETANGNADARPQMARIEAEQAALSRERVALLETYLAARPDFVFASFMRLELATRLAYIGRYDEARAIADRILRDAPESGEAAQAHRLLRDLAERGWIRPYR
jgi:hypothetical protein